MLATRVLRDNSVFTIFKGSAVSDMIACNIEADSSGYRFLFCVALAKATVSYSQIYRIPALEKRLGVVTVACDLQHNYVNEAASLPKGNPQRVCLQKCIVNSSSTMESDTALASAAAVG